MQAKVKGATILTMLASLITPITHQRRSFVQFRLYDGRPNTTATFAEKNHGLHSNADYTERRRRNRKLVRTRSTAFPKSRQPIKRDAVERRSHAPLPQSSRQAGNDRG